MKTILFSLSLLMVASAGATTNIEKLIHSAKAESFEAGQKIYQQYCMSCHATSNIMVSSPKFGDRKDWGERLMARGSMDKLVMSAIKGRGAMPKKGRCINCDANKLHHAVLYMMRGEEIQ